MSKSRKIDKAFENMSNYIFDNAKKVFTLVMVATVAIMTQLPNLKMDTTTEGFLHHHDPMRLAYDEFRDQFGRDEKILIAIKTEDVFNPEFLKKLSKLHNEVQNNLPYVADVTSLINARSTYGSDDVLHVDDLFEDSKFTKEEIKRQKKIALENPIYRDLLIGSKNQWTNIIIDTQTYSSYDSKGEKIVVTEEDEFGESEDEFSEEGEDSHPKNNSAEDEHMSFDAHYEEKLYLTDPENTELMNKVKELTEKYNDESFEVYLAGSALFNDVMKQTMMKDMEGFMMKMIVAITIILFLMFRRAAGVFLPIVSVALTVVATVATMAANGVPFTMATQIMPSFLLAVIAAGSIHILAIYYKSFKKPEDSREAIAHAMSHSGFAIIMTSLTTAAGMWSFSFSEVAPVADLGLYSSLGMIYGLIYMLVLMPALISMFNLKPINKDNITENASAMDNLLLWFANSSLKNAKKIVVSSVVIVITSVVIATQMNFSHHPLVWFQDDAPARVAVEQIDENLRGSVNIEILIDTKKENGLYDPKMLRKIEKASNYISTYENEDIFVGKTLSIVDILKETNRALNNNTDEHYSIPTERDLIAQELFLFSNSGSDDMEDYVDSTFQKARIIVKVPYVEALKFNSFVSDIKVELDSIFEDTATIEYTGIGVLLGSVMEKSIKSSAVSYMIAFAMIAVMMMMLMGSVKMGAISMLPNILPILILITIMVIFDIPLDMFSMLVGSIALGIAVDDSVHFNYNYKKYRSLGYSVDDSVRKTLLGTGRAIMVTSAVLSIGFLVLLTATMTNMFNFGILTASAIFIALLADFVLMPAIFKLIDGDKKNEIK